MRWLLYRMPYQRTQRTQMRALKTLSFLLGNTFTFLASSQSWTIRYQYSMRHETFDAYQYSRISSVGYFALPQHITSISSDFEPAFGLQSLHNALQAVKTRDQVHAALEPHHSSRPEKLRATTTRSRLPKAVNVPTTRQSLEAIIST